MIHENRVCAADSHRLRKRETKREIGKHLDTQRDTVDIRLKESSSGQMQTDLCYRFVCAMEREHEGQKERELASLVNSSDVRIFSCFDS